MNSLIAIAVGGGLGALARHFLSAAVQPASGQFPWGIFVVNVLGGFLMGFLVELGATKFAIPLELRALLATGLLGGFTTFSTFSLDTAVLIERGDWFLAVLYITGSVLLSVGALFAGLWVVRLLS